MALLKRNYLTILLVSLLVSVIVFLFVNFMFLGESYFREEVYIKNLVIDLICDVAEAGGAREALVDAVGEIDTFKQRGVYCAAYVPDASNKNGFRVISMRSPLFGPYDPLDNTELKRDVRLQNRGKTVITREKTELNPEHELHVYFRWVYRDTEEPVVIVLGMSKFSVETDHEKGLKIGSWIIAAASVIVVTVAANPIIKRKRGGA